MTIWYHLSRSKGLTSNPWRRPHPFPKQSAVQPGQGDSMFQSWWAELILRSSGPWMSQVCACGNTWNWHISQGGLCSWGHTWPAFAPPSLRMRFVLSRISLLSPEPWHWCDCMCSGTSCPCTYNPFLLQSEGPGSQELPTRRKTLS